MSSGKHPREHKTGKNRIDTVFPIPLQPGHHSTFCTGPPGTDAEFPCSILAQHGTPFSIALPDTLMPGPSVLTAARRDGKRRTFSQHKEYDPMSKHVVVIGGVALGPKAACRLKRLEPDTRVTLIDASKLISYGGCGIPYYISGDVSDHTQLQTTSFH